MFQDPAELFAEQHKLATLKEKERENECGPHTLSKGLGAITTNGNQREKRGTINKLGARTLRKETFVWQKAYSAKEKKFFFLLLSLRSHVDFKREN